MSASDVIGSERMEALLRGDAPRTAGEERRAALLDGLRAAQLRAPEALRARVLAPAPEPRPSRFRLPSRRLVFVLVPAAAALAVGAALVHGLVGSGGHPVAPISAQAFTARSRRRRRRTSATIAPAAERRRGAVRVTRSPRLPTGSATRLQHTAASLEVRVADTDKLSQATSRGDADRHVARRLRAVGRLPDAAGRRRHRVPRAADPGRERQAGARPARRARHARLAAGLGAGPPARVRGAVGADRAAAAVDRGAAAGAAEPVAPGRAEGAAPDPARRAEAGARAAAARPHGHRRRGHDRPRLARAEHEAERRPGRRRIAAGSGGWCTRPSASSPSRRPSRSTR